MTVSMTQARAVISDCSNDGTDTKLFPSSYSETGPCPAGSRMFVIHTYAVVVRQKMDAPETIANCAGSFVTVSFLDAAA